MISSHPSTTNHPTIETSDTIITTTSPSTLTQIPPGHVAFHLGPTTSKTVVTTTTITTLNFPPVLLPRPTSPTLLPESDATSLRGWSGRARWPIQPNHTISQSDPRLDPKLYPLATAPIPSDWITSGLPVPLIDGTITRFDPGQSASHPHPAPPPTINDKGKGKATTTTTSQQQDLSPPLDQHSQTHQSELSRKRASLSNPTLLSIVTPSQASTLPPRKKVRLNDLNRHQEQIQQQSTNRNSNLDHTGQSKSQSSTHPISGLLSPLPTGFDQSAHPNTTSGTPTTIPNNQGTSITTSSDPQFPTHPFQSSNPQLGLLTITSLPSLVSEFSRLPPHLQQYTLFNLLRASPVPVLQFIQDLIAPSLKRDFIQDLPPEISIMLLSRLDGKSLCRAATVSKTWNSLIDSSSILWKNRLVVEDLWIGDESETIESEECRLIESGVPRSEASHFTRLWNRGVWRSKTYDRSSHKEDGVNLKEKVDEHDRSEQENEPTSNPMASPSQNMNLDDGLVPASPASAEPLRRRHLRGTNPSSSESSSKVHHQPTSLNSPIQSRASHPKLSHRHSSQTNHEAFDQRIIDKYKLLYRKRFLLRRNWKQNEPKRYNFRGHGLTVVTCLQFDWDKLVAASDDTLIHSYELRTGKMLTTFTGHQGGVWALQYVANVLVTGSTDRTVRVWDMRTGRNTHIFGGHTSTVRCLQIVEPINLNPDRDGPPIWEPEFPLIVTGSRDFTLRVWKLPTEDDDEYLPGPLPGSPETSLSDDNDSIFMTAHNPFHLFFLPGHTHAVRALAAEGRTVVSGSYDHTVRVWDLINGQCQHEMRGHTAKVYSVVIDRKHMICASGSMDNTVRLWDLVTGTSLNVMNEHTSLVGLLGFSQSRLVSAAADSTLRIWNAKNGESLHELRGHANAITCFKHDEFKVVSGSDGTIKLWDTKNGHFERDLCVGYQAVWQLNFDERFCVVAVQHGNQSEYEVLDFGRCDGRSDEEDLERLRRQRSSQDDSSDYRDASEIDSRFEEVKMGDEEEEMMMKIDDHGANDGVGVGDSSSGDESVVWGSCFQE